MGLFNSYTKPGKGVSKDEPEKKGFFLFWDVFFHKLTKILGANALYTILSLLWLVILCVIGIHFVLPTAPDVITNVINASGAESPETLISFAVLSVYAMFATTAFTFLGSGPVSASYAYIVKCFANREHVWMMSDGWDKLKENFIQAIIVILIDAVALIAVPVAIRFYGIMSADSAFYTLLCYIMIVFAIIYVWMHFYIYQIMVTFKCTLKELYQNALICAFAKLPMNIFLTIVCGAVSILTYTFITNSFIAVIFSTVIGMCFTRFVVEFYAARCIAKIIPDDQDGADDGQEEAVFDDNLLAKLNSSEEKK